MLKCFLGLFGFGKESRASKIEKTNAIVEIYRDKGKQWRWRMRAANGNIIANGGEGYKNKGDCVAMIDSISRGINVIKRLIQDQAD